MRRAVWGLLLLLLTATGCSRPEAVVVLADLTASSRESREQMVAAFEKVLAELNGNTRLFVVAIEANSLVTPVEIALEPPAAPGSLFGANGYTERRELKKLREKASREFRTLLGRARQDRPGSAIVDAVARAEKLLLPADPARRTLVVLSDGFEQGDLADLSGLHREEVSPLVKRLRAARQVPDLQGTCVYFAGITEGDRSAPVSRETLLAVGQFWQEFFRAAGARLELYEPTLVRFKTGGCSGLGA